MMMNVLWLCLSMPLFVQAASGRKRVRKTLEVVQNNSPHDEENIKASNLSLLRGGLEQDVTADWRRLRLDMVMSMPVESPVAPPVDPPVAAPVDPAASNPVGPPVDAPTLPPTRTSMSPTRPPVVAPTTTPAPVAPPVDAPTPPPNRVSLSPTKPPVVAPTTTPAPVQSPIDPTPAPTITPVDPTPAPTPTSENRNKMIKEKCGVSVLERSRDILSVLTLISEPVTLITPGTPQFKSRNWLDSVDDAIICANNRQRIEQRYTMALMYYAMGGSEWTNCKAESAAVVGDVCEQDTERRRNLRKGRGRELQEHEFGAPDAEEDASVPAVRFLDGSNECDWYGLDCGDGYDPNDEDDRYFPIGIVDLSDNNLAGSLFMELWGMVELTSLSLDANRRITGMISEQVGKLTKLKFLDLDDNSLSGTVPSAIYSMTNLQAIDLNENQFLGEITNDIGNLAELRVLQLENNMFTGPVPTAGLFELSQLLALTIEGNMFTGSLEPICEVRDERREDYEMYLMFAFADCADDPPLVECSCCECS